MARSVCGFRRLGLGAALPLLAIGVVLLALTKPVRASEYEAAEPGPVGTLRVSRPTLSWKFLPVGDTKVTGVALTLNGAPVPAAYDPAKQAVIYTPAEPLGPGAYAVKCTVTLDGEWPVSEEWRFTIAPSAQASVPAPDAAQRNALTAANAYRRALGLPPLRLDPRLCAAARAHSDYLSRNRMLAHDQKPGQPGYLAANPDDRRAVFGYAGGCFENIDQGSRSVEQAVQGLFDAPYHRVAFLQPGSPDFGAGMVGDRTTLEVGTTEESGIVTYPGAGQRDVPTNWGGDEIPDPLRVHLARGPVGYAITYFYFSPSGDRIRVAHARITNGEGAPIPIYLNTPDNDDHLQNGALLIPRQPLRPGASYQVAVNAKTESGEDLSRTWNFTTTSERQMLGSPVPLDRSAEAPIVKPMPDTAAKLPRRRQSPAKRLVNSDKKTKRILVEPAEETELDDAAA